MDWKLFFSTFALVFLAELGDKTQLTVLAQSSAHRAPWCVFLAGASALVAASAVGAFAGGLLSRWLSPVLLQRLGAALFLAFGALMLLQSFRH